MDALATIIKRTFAEHGAAGTVAGMTLVELAIAFGRFDLLAWLFEHGLRADARDRHGRTALFRVGHAEGVRLLLDRGASIHHVDRAGNGPLHAAAKAGRLEVVRELIARGADPKARNRRGLTPLHIAAQHGQKEVLAELLGQGVDIDALDRRGRPALFGAVVGGHLACAKFLVAEGANCTLTDRAGKGWLSMARDEHVSVLRRAWARGGQDWAPDPHGGERLAQRLAAERRAYRPHNWTLDLGL